MLSSSDMSFGEDTKSYSPSVDCKEDLVRLGAGLANTCFALPIRYCFACEVSGFPSNLGLGFGEGFSGSAIETAIKYHG